VWPGIGGFVRLINDQTIKAHANARFKSEYHYALFEYHRSAKVLAVLEKAGVPLEGRVLDAGCGGGGMPLSLAEEARHVVGIDLSDRFQDAGTRLAREMGLANLAFARANGMALPFQTSAFDLVLSHAVIEHVADAARYLRECARVLRPGGWMYLSTAPYLSFAGAHLPRLLVPIPLHLILGRRVSFALFRFLARHAPWSLREPVHENSFIKLARLDECKDDDLLELVRVPRLRRQIRDAGFRIVREDLHLTRTFRRLPGPIPAWLRACPVVQDIVVGNMEYVLRHEEQGVGAHA
jgi:SAM-dependent methyltransferase